MVAVPGSAPEDFSQYAVLAQHQPSQFEDWETVVPAGASIALDGHGIQWQDDKSLYTLDFATRQVTRSEARISDSFTSPAMVALGNQRTFQDFYLEWKKQ